MKIAFFHNLPDGGAKRVVFEQVKYLSQKHDVNIYELVNEENFFNLKSLGVNVKRYEFNLEKKILGLNGRFINDLNNFITLKSLHKKIANDIDKENYDIIIVHPDKFTQAPFLLTYLKTNNIYYCEELLRIVYETQFKFNNNVSFIKRMYENSTRKIRKYIDFNNAKSANVILANSKFTTKKIRDAYLRDCITAYPGVDNQLFRPLLQKKMYDIIFIGEKTVFDGYDLLEKCVSLFKIKPIVKIVSRKNGKYLMNDKELIKEYNRSKITICLNHEEPFGFIPLESMACGIPVVAVNEGGFSETVSDQITGLLVKRDPVTIYNATYGLLQNDNLRNKMSNQARNYILRSWTWEISINNLLNIINKCIKNHLKE